MEWPLGGELRRVLTGDGTSLAVHALGQGPPLLMLPGLGTDHHAFVWNVADLSRDFECLALDQRGLGLSEATPGPYSMEQLADDAASVLRQFAPRGGCVFGVSMGGMVAQHLAIRHPQLVRDLVLGCTGPGGQAAVRAADEVTRKLLGGDARDPGSVYRVACEVLYQAEFRRRHPEVIEEAVAWRSQHPVRAGVFQAQWQAIRHHDAAAGLARLRVPTLVLHGDSDLVMPPANALTLARLIPGAELDWMGGRGHMFFQEDVAETNARLRRRLLSGSAQKLAL